MGTIKKNCTKFLPSWEKYFGEGIFYHKFSVFGREIATIAPQYESVLEIFYFHILHIAKYD
jgi:hypothetical protein